jgi:hypothetical protein
MLSPRLWSTRVSRLACSTLSAAAAIAAGDGPDCVSRRFLVAACSREGGLGLIAVRSTPPIVSTTGASAFQAPPAMSARAAGDGCSHAHKSAATKASTGRARRSDPVDLTLCEVSCKSRSIPNDAFKTSQ